MKKIIKNLSIVVVAIILLSACKKEDEVKPFKITSDTTNTKNNMFKYYGTYYQSRNVNDIGDDRICENDGSVLGYEISKDSISILFKDNSNQHVSVLITSTYTEVIVGDSVELWYDGNIIIKIRQGVAPYDLIAREYYAPLPGAATWVDHYLKKQ